MSTYAYEFTKLHWDLWKMRLFNHHDWKFYAVKQPDLTVKKTVNAET